MRGTDLKPLFEVIAAGLCGKVAAIGVAVLGLKGLFGQHHLGLVRDKEEVMCQGEDVGMVEGERGVDECLVCC